MFRADYYGTPFAHWYLVVFRSRRLPMNSEIKKMVRAMLISIHSRHGIDYCNYSQEWREYVEALAWRSIHARSVAKQISINEAIKEVL